MAALDSSRRRRFSDVPLEEAEEDYRRGYCSGWEWRPGYFRRGIGSESAAREIRGRRDGYCEVTAIQWPVAASVHASEFQFDLKEPIFQDLKATGQRRIQIGLVDFDFSKPYRLNL